MDMGLQPGNKFAFDRVGNRPELPLLTRHAWSPSRDHVNLFHDGPKGATQLTMLDEGTHRILSAATVESFISMAIDIPGDLRKQFDSNQILRVEVALSPSRPLTTYVRLNIRFGPDIDGIPKKLGNSIGHCCVEFDLVTTAMRDRPMQHAWVDLIFEDPQATVVDVSDIRVSLRPRARF